MLNLNKNVRFTNIPTNYTPFNGNPMQPPGFFFDICFLFCVRMSMCVCMSARKQSMRKIAIVTVTMNGKINKIKIGHNQYNSYNNDNKYI